MTDEEHATLAQEKENDRLFKALSALFHEHEILPSDGLMVLMEFAGKSLGRAQAVKLLLDGITVECAQKTTVILERLFRQSIVDGLVEGIAEITTKGGLK